MSHPRGYDAHDAPPTQAFPPREDGTQVLPATPSAASAETSVLPPQSADRTQVFAPQGGDRTQVFAPQSGGTTPPPGPPLRTASSRPVGSRPAPVAAAPSPAAAPRQAAAPAPASPWGAAPAPAAAPAPVAARAAAPAPAPAGVPGHGAPQRRGGTEPTAVAALITGIFGFVVPLLGVLAIVLGGIGMDRTRRRGTGGRGMAVTGVTFGSIQVVVTAVLVVVGLMLWNTYGDDIEQALAQAEDVTQTDLSIPDLLLGGLSSGMSLDDLRELAGTLGDTDRLQELGGQCQAGDPTSCEDLLDSLPDGIRDQLPEELRSQLPGS
ncbi:DUF4190 domain-containing protein [Isoptericola sp. NPDC057191]|uniref:DUF4190 domain-containing protein n=1 Tax=Isoptericola sp. NPDC057191 TaxID=3346041 RepID=UPI00362693C5